MAIASPRFSAAVIGAGGHIGSHLIPLLGRMPGVARVTLVDRDTYSRANAATQNISAGEVGRAKAVVQARRLLDIAPALAVRARVADVEDVPLGQLRADLLFSCLDSRRARQVVNEIAMHLGVPWVDAGVAVLAGGAELARVSSFLPGPDQACLECAWDQRDYELLEPFPCGGGAGQAPPTGAPAYLGSLAASLQAQAGRATLAGRASGGRQVIVDASHRTLVESTVRRNPRCRIADHAPWSIADLGASASAMTVAEAFACAGRASGDGGDVLLSVEGGRLELGVKCWDCGYQTRHLRFRRLPRFIQPACPHCASALLAIGAEPSRGVPVRMVAEGDLARSLLGVGLRGGDVLRFTGVAGVKRFEVRIDERRNGR